MSTPRAPKVLLTLGVIFSEGRASKGVTSFIATRKKTNTLLGSIVDTKAGPICGGFAGRKQAAGAAE